MLTQVVEEKVFHKGIDKPILAEAEAIVERAMVAEPLPEVEIPFEIKEKAQKFIDLYVAKLVKKTEDYMERLPVFKEEMTKRATEVEKLFGRPVLPSGYQYWNCLTVGPIQFSGAYPYRPNKIIRAGEPTMMLGIVWVNPMNSDGGGLPGTVVLGGRHYRYAFETMNLSHVTDGPDLINVRTFNNPAQVVNYVPWFFTPTLTGNRPILYETNFTVDIVEMGQPMAAFSTWHYDIDREPPFLFLPPAGPELRHEIPARYLVYPE